MSQTNSPTAQTSAPMSGTEPLPVSGDQAVSPPVIEEVSIGHQQASPAAAPGQADQETLSAPDLGVQKNAVVKTVRIAARGWEEGSRFVDAEHFWSQLEDEVSAVYLRCWMYPNLETVHLTVAGLEEAYLPAGAPATFAVVYRTDTDTVYIADVKNLDKQQQKQQQQDAAPGNGGKRDLVVRIDIDPAVVDRHNELDWMPVLCKEAVEREDAYLDSPEFHHRLVWEIAQRIVDESLWKPTPRASPIVVGNLELMTGGDE
ncbi:hypothetical protein LZ31DRAFT_260161 [Colletotrichum somersetense]|nr:hypothetical protein LZ31DRAFT_260161 [Colletotrichum somersetense]